VDLERLLGYSRHQENLASELAGTGGLRQGIRNEGHKVEGWHCDQAHHWLDPKISYSFHNSLLGVELIGMRPFIFHGSSGQKS
jgi:hypothetical protein